MIEMPPPQITRVPKRRTFSSKVNVEWLKMAIDRHIAALKMKKKKRLHENQFLHQHLHLEDTKRTRKFKIYYKKTNKRMEANNSFIHSRKVFQRKWLPKHGNLEHWKQWKQKTYDEHVICPDIK